MAETAKILNPDKQVLLPDLNAGCSLADSCPPEEFAAFISRHPGHLVMSYINCSLGVKALSDIICTSSNAEKLIAQIDPQQPIIFAPDQHLGRYLIQRTGRPMVLWPGFCQVHVLFSHKKLLQQKWQYPKALLLAHPECPEPILKMADYIGSTSALLAFAVAHSAEQFIVATEPGIIHQMQKRAPGKQFIPALSDQEGCSCNQCPHMRLNTLEKVYQCMQQGQPSISVNEALRIRACVPLKRMLAMSAH